MVQLRSAFGVGFHPLVAFVGRGLLRSLTLPREAFWAGALEKLRRRLLGRLPKICKEGAPSCCPSFSVANKPVSVSVAPLLEVRGLTFSYASVSSSSGGCGIVLEDISFSLQAGDLVAIVGPNGGGKSTLLKLLVGLLQPVRGSFSHSLSPQEIGYLPQRSEFDPVFPLRVVDVVAMGLWARTGTLRRLSREDYRSLIKPALERVGLAGYETRGLHCLSGGQFQRLLFARLLVQDASFLLLDEPFSAIDSETMEDLLGLLKELQQQGKTIVVVSHHLELVRRFCPLSLILSKGLVAFGSTEEVLTRSNLSQALSFS